MCASVRRRLARLFNGRGGEHDEKKEEDRRKIATSASLNYAFVISACLRASLSSGCDRDALDVSLDVTRAADRPRNSAAAAWPFALVDFLFARSREGATSLMT